MDKAWKKYLDTASGLTHVTRKGAERVVRGLVKQGEVAADQVERMVDDLLKRSEKNRKMVTSLVRSEVEKTVQRLGLAREADVDRLHSRVSSLAAGGTQTARPARPASKTASKTASKKSAKKSAAARRAAKSAATTAKSSKSTTTRPTSAKKSAKKSTAKKSTAKRATVKKSASKSASAKKVTRPSSGSA